jgi:hypothetical protein
MEELVPMKRKRGGAMLFVLVMVGLMTIAVLAGVELSTSAASLASRSEAEAKARFAVDGAMQMFLCDYRKKTKSLPSNSVYTVGSLKVDLKAVNNSASKARTIRFDGSTTVQGKTYAFSRVAGDRIDPNPLDYALFVNSNFDPVQSVTLGANGTLGDLSVNGSIVNRANPFVINGDVEAIGSTMPTGAVVRGNLMTGESAIGFATPNGLDYLVAALVSLLVGVISDYVFPGLDPYPVIYRLGNLDLKGTFTGKGTIFVNGNATISGNIRYGTADSRLVLIASGGIQVNAGVTEIHGFYYTNGTFRNDGALRLPSGAVAAQAISLGGSLEIIHDPIFWNDPSEAVKHKVPGYWP